MVRKMSEVERERSRGKVRERECETRVRRDNGIEIGKLYFLFS